jgi:hypothetical protein
MRLARALVLTGGILLLSPNAFADETALDACSAAAVTGQKLRRAGKLREAKSWFEVCTRPSCREDILHDCQTWQQEIDRSIPTIAVHPRDESGQPTPDARVVIDGTLVPAESLAQAIPLDPGPHTIDFERPDAPRVSRSITLSEGDHIDVAATMASRSPRPLAKEPADEQPRARAGAIPTAAVVSGIVAAAGLLAFGTLAAVGYSDYASSKCDVSCGHADASRVHTTLLLADVSLAVAAVAGGLTAFFFFDRPAAPR